MNTCISRVMAERDLRAIDVGAYAGSDAKGIQSFKQHLTIELGDVMVMKADPIASAVRDEVGFQKLKAMTMK